MLGEHGASAADAIPALFSLINYADINYRSHIAACTALSKIGDRATPYLIHALHHGSHAAKKYSAIALSDIGIEGEHSRLVADILRSEGLANDAT